VTRNIRTTGLPPAPLIVGLTWQLPTAPNYAILNRLADGLVEGLRAIPGTDKVERFGDPDEEIQVTIEADRLARLGLTAPALSQQIAASDAKVSAGGTAQRSR
jgi:multidrug efflux pump subunit AcrB